ncbi:hypothetical protein PG997_008204 [Apiospora hydei]|uniref:Chromo domain-containing protein n=1 Tax=Apiospora hydei TaxID=1337664 RepID=A0ABR1WA69_9PEZI
MAPRILQLTSNGDFSNSETAGGSRFKHNRHVNRILAELRTIFPKNNELTISTVQYSPNKKDIGDTMFNSHRGKLLVQYQPAPKKCDDNANIDEAEQSKAMWRVWFEGHDIGDRHAEWVPADHQHLKRDERSCPIKAPTGTATPTTQGPAPTPTETQTDLPPPRRPRLLQRHATCIFTSTLRDPKLYLLRWTTTFTTGATSRNTQATLPEAGTKSTFADGRDGTRTPDFRDCDQPAAARCMG